MIKNNDERERFWYQKYREAWTRKFNAMTDKEQFEIIKNNPAHAANAKLVEDALAEADLLTAKFYPTDK